MIPPLWKYYGDQMISLFYTMINTRTMTNPTRKKQIATLFRKMSIVPIPFIQNEKTKEKQIFPMYYFVLGPDPEGQKMLVVDLKTNKIWRFGFQDFMKPLRQQQQQQQQQQRQKPLQQRPQQYQQKTRQYAHFPESASGGGRGGDEL